MRPELGDCDRLRRLTILAQSANALVNGPGARTARSTSQSTGHVAGYPLPFWRVTRTALPALSTSFAARSTASPQR